MKETFTLEWDYPKRFSVVKKKNVLTLFQNLNIEVLHTEEKVINRRIYTIFTLSGTKEDQARLESYMEKVRMLTSAS